MKAEEIRSTFIEFFQHKDHEFIRSSPVIPYNDPTLLFTNAGMNQFKPIFLDEQSARHPRVVNSQKCIRVSGKHNDLEEVGLDSLHHTFFEMLGNWSFGDYYKAEAIAWAWELFTDVWGLDKDRLWATVYEADREAYELWPQVTDIDPSRVLQFGTKDNFWEMGTTGPCGSCSEIHYYTGADLSKQSAKGVNTTKDYWELWNLVFIQNNRQEDGSLVDLPAKHVDTGAGLERIVAILQGKISNYETDLFTPIIQKTEELTGKKNRDNQIPFQVIADHVRMLSFAIADGVLPANEGRGYVLRRILRRAARFGRMLDSHEPFIYKLVETISTIMGTVFPELIDKREHIKKVIQIEEKSFNEMLDRGIVHFEKILNGLVGDTINGADAFKLYDTYGFPIDLTQLMAREMNLKVDLDGFNREMDFQRKRAKDASKFKPEMKNFNWIIVSAGSDSTFLGYQTHSTKASIKRYAEDNGTLLLILNETPFYAESGGQIADIGTIQNSGIDLAVNDVQKDHESFVHFCTGDFNPHNVNETVFCQVDKLRRSNIKRNHTATHLLHKALKLVLGNHVNQAGSLVHPDYLRFDLTHNEKINPEEIHEIERIVNNEILNNTPVNTALKDYDEAKKEGALAMFGEKYGEKVRVLSIGDFSMELCGGTHVERTGDIGFFKVIEESSLASGVRRIIALTGSQVLEHIQEQAKILAALQSMLTSSTKDLTNRVNQLLQKKKELEKQLKLQQKTSSSFDVKTILKNASRINESAIVIHDVGSANMDTLKSFGDELLSTLDSGIGVLGSAAGEKPEIVVVVTKDLIDAGIIATDLARAIGSAMGGGGGGRAHLATAGGKDKMRFHDALKYAKKIIQDALIG